MSKQTAVEWLVDEIEKNYIINNGTLDPIKFMELKRQAKAMEKEQIIEAYRYGESNNFYRTEISAKDYYTSTYDS
jgi:hypothetical protein